MAPFNKSFLFIFLFFVQFSVTAQLVEELRTEILMYITPEAMVFEESETEAINIGEIEFLNEDLFYMLENYEVSSIQKAFPDYLDSDTVFVDENEKAIKLPQLSRIYRVHIRNEEDIDRACEDFGSIYGVLFAEKNMDAYLGNDPYYHLQWYLKNTGQTGGVPGADINIEKAWSYFTGDWWGSIGIVDAGVKHDHEDLAGRVHGDAPMGDTHGTQVAGVAAANTNNNLGIKGVDHAARIRSARIFEPGYVGDAIAANKIINLANQAANVINHSWGGPGYKTLIGLAMAHAYKQDRISVAIMHNWYTSGNPTIYPGAFKNGVIAVGATGSSDIRTSYSQTGNHIDIVAPGGEYLDIYSTTMFSTNSYGYTYGTSFAAPLVSGVASLLKWKNIFYSADDIENILKLSAKKVLGMSGQNWTTEYGYGRLDAGRAFEIIQSPFALTHHNVTGGTAYSSSGHFNMNIFGASGLADRNYRVKRYEVRKNISFSNHYNHSIWGNSYLTAKGWSAEDQNNTNYSTGFCELVPGTLTSTSATIRTYVYEVWSYNILGQLTYKGWYPSTPSNVNLNYTLYGVPLSGPPLPPQNLVLTVGSNNRPVLNWSANTDPDLSGYRVYRKITTAGGPSTSYFFTTSTTYTDNNFTISKFGSDQAEYWIVAVDNTNQLSPESNHQNTSGYSSIQWKLGEDTEDEIKITEYNLSQPYPNPFNPSTTIAYQIPKDGVVSLIIYDILGKEVQTLIKEYQTSGKYEIKFDASNLPSGTYIYSFRVNDYSQNRKMLFMK